MTWVKRESEIENILPKLYDLAEFQYSYKRIFQRINELPYQHRERSRKVLGWIACAPIPMMTFEMEQAILINPSLGHVPTGIFRHDFLDMWCPFIEIVDERLQFVHFTVQE
jgi:hypothetical protein